MSAQPTPASSSPQLPRTLLIVSTLCWLCAILLGLGGIALLAAVLLDAAKGQNPMALLGLLPVFALGLGALAYGVAGYFVRKGRRIGGWIAVLTAGLVTALRLPFLLPSEHDAPSVWTRLPSDAPPDLGMLVFTINVLNLAFIALNLAIIVLLVFNWRHLRPLSRQVGA